MLFLILIFFNLSCISSDNVSFEKLIKEGEAVYGTSLVSESSEKYAPESELAVPKSEAESTAPQVKRVKLIASKPIKKYGDMYILEGQQYESFHSVVRYLIENKNDLGSSHIRTTINKDHLTKKTFMALSRYIQRNFLEGFVYSCPKVKRIKLVTSKPIKKDGDIYILEGQQYESFHSVVRYLIKCKNDLGSRHIRKAINKDRLTKKEIFALFRYVQRNFLEGFVYKCSKPGCNQIFENEYLLGKHRKQIHS